jgi:formylglycine-generating enzyme required for sulfatase activity
MEVDGNQRYFDLYHGVELKPEARGTERKVLSFSIEANGFGAVLASPNALSNDVLALMTKMKAMTAVPLANYPHEWKFLPQQIVPIEATKHAGADLSRMVRIPEGNFDFEVSGIEIEGLNEIGLDVQYPWEDSPRRFHSHPMHLHSFYIDKYPITNAEFKKFVDAAHYRPKDGLNFLRDWKDGSFPVGWENRPVTWVSLDDARAYAKWAGKRLPHEWEWQYAAQGSDRRVYPWGDEWNATAVPLPDKSRTMRAPDAVDAHPKGASPFGVMDLVGNVWQWTEEFGDEHTRAAILRGGNYYQPQGSIWYFPEAYKLSEHGKLLLMAPGMDRSGTVGFRCVVDAE